MLYQFEFIILYFDNGRNLGVVFQLKIGHNCTVMLKVICDEDSARVFYPFFFYFFFTFYFHHQHFIFRLEINENIISCLHSM